MQKDTFKSIAAVLAGFVSVFVLSVLTDMALERTGIFPPQSEPKLYVWWMLLVALVYRTFYGAVGGYITASIAPRRCATQSYSAALGLSSPCSDR